jgi:hypothetical protein
VVRSASRLALGLATAGGLAGCATTMQEAARLQLNDARIRASQVPTRVTTAGHVLHVESVTTVTGGGRTAFVVRVTNPSRRPVSDLPISVGVRVRGRRPLYVNALSPLEFSYFDAHLPVVPAGSTLTWVYTTHRHLPAAGRTFALVGAKPSPPAPAPARLPVIRATTGAAEARTGQGLNVVLQSLTTVPQYQLQLYAFAERRGRVVAAGNVTVAELGGQATRRLTLGLLGRPGSAPIRVEAHPTTFQ